MNKILLLAGVACIMAANASAFEFNPYVAAKAKYAFTRGDVKTTGAVNDKTHIRDEVAGGSVALGTIMPTLTGAFRLEGEFTKNGEAEDNHYGTKLKLKTYAALFNVYYDLNLRTAVPVTPYVGVGIGFGRSEYKSPLGNKKDTNVALQIGGGVNYQINRNFSLDLGYRYITYGDFDKTYEVPGIYYMKQEYKPRAHEILLGVRYTF